MKNRITLDIKFIDRDEKTNTAFREDAEYVGGLNLFGEHFGTTAKTSN
jgi:predicted transcriptional regulator